jgi:hypothetical protein
MPSNPADQLNQLKQELAADQAKSTDLSKEMDRRKAQIADLTKTVSEIDSKSKGYEKNAAAITQQQLDLAAYIKDQKTALEAKVSNKGDIGKKKGDALQHLGDLSQAVTDANTEAAKNLQAWNDAVKAKADKQAAYDDIVGLPARNDAVLADLNQLRAAAEKEGAANNVGHKYLLILVMGDVIQKLKLPAPAEYLASLDSAASDLATASGAEKLAKDASDKASVDVQQAQKDLDTARSTWRKEVLDSIPVGNPPAAATAPHA